MDMSELFSSDGVRAALMEQSNPLISFQAGILNRDSSTSRVTADPRQGSFQIILTDDRLMHLQWRARGSTNIEHDLILIPGETEFKQVQSCPATARVYVLKWKEAPQRLFFWMQGNEPSQDAVHVTFVNSILEGGSENQQAARTSPMDTNINQINSSNSMETPSGPSININNDSSPSPPPQQEENDNNDNDDNDVVMQPQTINRNTSDFQPLSAEQLSEALANRRSNTNTNRETLLEQQRELVQTTPTIPDLLSVDAMQPILQNEQVKQKLSSLLQHLPEQDRHVDRIIDILRTPQFRSQAASLSYALQSGHAPDILRSFDLPVDASSSSYGLKAFLDALLEYEKNQNGEQ